MSSILRNYIAELRVSSEIRRKRFLIYGSGISMLLVIVLWTLYLNLNVQGIGNPAAEQTVSEAPKNDFFSTMKRGSAILYAQFADFIQKEFSKKKEITIDTKENFQSGEVPALSPQEIK